MRDVCATRHIFRFVCDARRDGASGVRAAARRNEMSRGGAFSLACVALPDGLRTTEYIDT